MDILQFVDVDTGAPFGSQLQLFVLAWTELKPVVVSNL